MKTKKRKPKNRQYYRGFPRRVWNAKGPLGELIEVARQLEVCVTRVTPKLWTLTGGCFGIYIVTDRPESLTVSDLHGLKRKNGNQ